MDSDFNDFLQLVQKMRRCQRDFFRFRQKEDLQKSKELERQVDQKLSEYLQVPAN